MPSVSPPKPVIYAAPSAGHNSRAAFVPSTAPYSGSRDILRTSLHTLLLLALIGECLWPFKAVLIDMNPIWLPSIFVLLAIGILTHRRNLTLGIKLFIFLCCLCMITVILYAPKEDTTSSLFNHIGKVITQDYDAVVHFHIERVSIASRMFLFFWACSFFWIAIQSMISDKQFPQFLVYAILVYLWFIQYVVDIDTLSGMIRTFTIGLLGRMYTYTARLQDHYPSKMLGAVARSKRIGITICLFSVVCLSGWCMANWLKPQVEPLFNSQEVHSFLPFTSKFAQLFTIHRIPKTSHSGYSQNDTLLGGPMRLDNHILFVAKSTDTTYWKAETKSLYTGTGWLTGIKPSFVTLTSQRPFISQVDTHEIELIGNSHHNQLYFPGNLVYIQQLTNHKEKQINTKDIRIDVSSGKLKLPFFSGQIKRYIVSTIPELGITDSLLIKNQMASNHMQLLQSNLQLPQKLPPRITELAKQISLSAFTPYDKAKAIEHYLRSSYTYSLNQPTRPEKGQDLVEHFLFNEKIGYCTHFSTAMVVMLRTIGIPARWVKGFVPNADNISHEFKTITFRAKDAHAWVEAYFPQLGWVSFEPTPGYPVNNELPKLDEQLISVFSNSSHGNDYKKQTLFTFILIGIGILIATWLLVICASGLLKKRNLSPKYRSKPYLRFSNKGQWEFPQHSDQLFNSNELFNRLEQRYGYRASSQTYREYIKQLPIQNDELTQLLHNWLINQESMVYNRSDYGVRPQISASELLKALHH